MIKEAIARVVEGRDLSEEEMTAAMTEIMGGEATDAQIGALITALRIKGETVDEIVGAAKVMREKAARVEVETSDGILVDTCGTGGDGAGTFNVSTTAAFVVAAAEIPVAKHGNRSVSSHCGSADVLEALGVNLNLTPEKIARCIKETGIGFMFAPLMHGAMKYAIGPRREIAIRTIFNALGPLTNPAGASVQVMGVYSPDLVTPIARVLGRLGARRALVVWGEGNLDELTVTGETRVAEWAGEIREYVITPEEVGLPRAGIEDIRGRDSAEGSAQQVREILAGQEGPCLDMVCLNAGAAIMAAGRAETLQDGVAMARGLVMDGSAAGRLAALVEVSRREGAAG